MPELLISPDELREVADAFHKASKDSQQISQNLEDAMKDLEAKWRGASEQIFYREYTEWHKYMLGFAPLLGNIAREIDALAERFAAVDK